MLQVLIVDDDPAVRESLSLALEGEFLVTTAASAEEAIEVLRSSQPAVMVLDQALPGLSGTRLLERLEGPGPNTVLISAAMDVALARQAMQLGADDLLAKPFDARDLVEKIRAAVGHPRRAKAEGPPFALRAAQAVQRTAEEATGLEQGKTTLERRLVAEALGVTAGDGAGAAQRLGMTEVEMDELAAGIVEKGLGS